MLLRVAILEMKVVASCGSVKVRILENEELVCKTKIYQIISNQPSP